MISRFFARLGKTVGNFLQHPLRVFAASFFLVGAGLLFDGTVIRLWRLNQDSRELASRMKVVRAESRELEKKINQAKDPNFIELEARERFDLASEGDLVFVFSDEE